MGWMRKPQHLQRTVIHPSIYPRVTSGCCHRVGGRTGRQCRFNEAAVTVQVWCRVWMNLASFVVFPNVYLPCFSVCPLWGLFFFFFCSCFLITFFVLDSLLSASVSRQSTCLASCLPSSFPRAPRLPLFLGFLFHFQQQSVLSAFLSFLNVWFCSIRLLALYYSKWF